MKLKKVGWVILSGTNQQHGKFGHISHMSVKFGHQVTLSSNKFQINSTKKIYFQRPQHFLVEFERKNGTCTGRAIIQRRATADYAPRNRICGGGCPYWQQAGTTDFIRLRCAQPIQPGCQLRMVSILSYPFFRCFYFLRTSKNRNTWNNWPATGFWVFYFDFLNKN